MAGEAEPPVSAAAAESVADLAGAPVWHNSANPADVNDDGLITPVDALIVANFLHVHGPSPVASLPATDGPHIYPDVNGDGQVSVADFDWIVGQLNSVEELRETDEAIGDGIDVGGNLNDAQNELGLVGFGSGSGEGDTDEAFSFGSGSGGGGGSGSGGGGGGSGSGCGGATDPPGVTLNWVTFKEGHTVSSDPDPQTGVVTPYDDQHWLAGSGSGNGGAARQWPVAYTQAETIHVTARFELDDIWQCTVWIRAMGTDGMNIPQTAVVPNDSEVILPIVAATWPLPGRVDYFESFELAWEISFDGGNDWQAVDTSANPLYVTYDDPVVDPLYHTLLHLGSPNAIGEYIEEDVVARIWNSFASLEVRRFDDTLMHYWHQTQPGATTTTGLLQHANGTCKAWADLLIDVLKAQGIDSADRIYVLHENGPFVDGFLVKNWNLIGDGSAPQHAPYVYVLGDDAVPVNSLDAQGNADPPPAFYEHFIVRYQGEYYDPSYGGGPYETQLEWENASLDGYFKWGIVDGQMRQIAKPNNSEKVQTIFAVN